MCLSPRVEELKPEVNKCVRTWTMESACSCICIWICVVYLDLYMYCWIDIMIIVGIQHKVFFYPVNPEEGTIPSGQLNYSKSKYLNIPGKELNVNDITEQIFFQEKS